MVNLQPRSACLGSGLSVGLGPGSSSEMVPDSTAKESSGERTSDKTTNYNLNNFDKLTISII